MTPLFKKLNFKDHDPILSLNHPDSFKVELDAMKVFCQIETDLSKMKTVGFVLVFVTEQKEIEFYITELSPKLEDDAVIWFCYPKKSSKNYTCNFDRDTGWQAMGKFDLEPVRMVAIDVEWSALRFRNVRNIKTLTRSASMALTKEAKKRTSGQGR